jgi:hypothetical protein
LVPTGLTDPLQAIEQQAHNLELWKWNTLKITFLAITKEINAYKNKYNTSRSKLSPTPSVI